MLGYPHFDTACWLYPKYLFYVKVSRIKKRPGRSCGNLNYDIPLAEENLKKNPNHFWANYTGFSVLMAKRFGREFKFSQLLPGSKTIIHTYTFLNLRHLYPGLKTRKRIFMYAIFIRFMFGCKHSTKGVIEFRIMAWDAHFAQ